MTSNVYFFVIFLKTFLISFNIWLLLIFFDDSGEEPVNIEANDLYALSYKFI